MPVSLLVAAGFAAVLATRTEDVTDATLTYGAGLPRPVRAGAPVHPRAAAGRRPVHVPARRRCSPAFGLVMIYRIDAELAREQAQWFVVGLALLLLTILAAARPPRARALPLHDRGGEHRAAADAAAAGHRRAGQRRVPRHQGRPDPVPAGGVRQARDHHLPRELPARDGRHPGATAAAAAALPAPGAALGRSRWRSRCSAIAVLDLGAGGLGAAGGVRGSRSRR